MPGTKIHKRNHIYVELRRDLSDIITVWSGYWLVEDLGTVPG
jgi:hypothetical protein